MCLMYVCYLLNHTYNETITGIPLNHLTGVTVDISPLLRFHFWQKVYYLREDHSFPSESKEAMGHIVGISEHCGHTLTWKVLTVDTKKILFRSQIRPCSDDDPNIRADMHDNAITNPIIKSRQQNKDTNIDTTTQLSGHTDQHADTSQVPTAPIIDPQDLLGRTFLMNEDVQGQRFRAQIVKLIEDQDTTVHADPGSHSLSPVIRTCGNVSHSVSV